MMTAETNVHQIVIVIHQIMIAVVPVPVVAK